MIEIAAAGPAFGAINSIFKLVDFIIALNEVGSENQVFVRTIQRVRFDLEETERLLGIPTIRTVLLKTPGKCEYIKNAIHNTKTALNEIGLYVERVRSDLERDGGVRFGHKLRWVLNDHGKLENRRSELATCHLALTTVLSILHPLELAGSFASNNPVDIQESPPPMYTTVSEESFFGPNQRRNRKSNHGIGVGVTNLEAGKESEGVYRNVGWQDPKGTQSQSEWSIPTSGQQTSMMRDYDSEPPQDSTPTPSVYTSCSNNNLGPVNPWEDWSIDPRKEVQQNVEMVDQAKDDWFASSSVMTSSTTYSSMARPSDAPVIPPKIPLHHNSPHEMMAASFENEEQARSWVTIGGPSMLYPVLESEENMPIELSAESDAEIRRSRPMLSRTKSIDFMSWLQNKTEDGLGNFNGQPKQASDWYNRHRSTPSIPNRSPLSFPTSPMERGFNQNQPSEIFRPRSQTYVYPQEMASINRPMSAFSAPLSFSSIDYFATPPIVPSSSGANDVSLMGQPRDVISKAPTQRGSQSRRRRAMMEAAVGVYGT